MEQQAAQKQRLDLTVSSEYSHASFSAQPMDVMLTLNSLSDPDIDDNVDGGDFKRSPIDLVCVVDTSESMKGEKMDLMRKTLQFMMSQLRSSDRISCVTFDQSVNVIFPLMYMTVENKKRASLLIDQRVQAGNCTNLSGGLLEALDIMKKRLNSGVASGSDSGGGGSSQNGEKRADVASILLFTDGLANVGIRNSKQIVTMVQKLLKNMDYTSTVFTFGFGTDHDANMLRDVAEAGHGLYYYIDSMEKIPETFGDCLGGLLSVVAQNIKIVVETVDNGVEIVVDGKDSSSGGIGSSMLIQKRNCNIIVPNHKVEFVVGDIYYEESKNLVFTVKLPLVRSIVDSQLVVKATVTYFDVIDMATVSFERQLSVKREGVTEAPTYRSVNGLLDQQRNRILCANALEEGRLLANKSNLEEARTVIHTAMNKIMHSPAYQKKDEFCEGLVKDMKDCLEDMNERTRYEQLGSKKLNNYWMSTAYERSTNEKSAAQSRYVTNSKKKTARFCSANVL